MDFTKIQGTGLGKIVKSGFWIMTLLFCAPLVVGHWIGHSRDWFAKIFFLGLISSGLALAYFIFFIPKMTPLYEAFPEIRFDQTEIYFALAAETLMILIGMLAYEFQQANRDRVIRLGRLILPRSAVVVMTIVSITAVIDDWSNIRDPDPVRSFMRLVKDLREEGDQEKIDLFNVSFRKMINSAEGPAL